MALVPRQLALYKSSVDVWRLPTQTFAGDGEPVSTLKYARVRTGMPGMWSYTQNDSDPSDAGRIKRRSALTEDQWHCEVVEDVRDQDILVDVTHLADGSRSPTYGALARVEGPPRKIPSLGRRHANKQVVQTFAIEQNEANRDAAFSDLIAAYS